MNTLLILIIAFAAVLLQKVYATNTTTVWKYTQSCVLLFIAILAVDLFHAGLIADEYALGGADVALFGVYGLPLFFFVILLHGAFWIIKNRFIQKRLIQQIYD